MVAEIYFVFAPRKMKVQSVEMLFDYINQNMSIEDSNCHADKGFWFSIITVIIILQLQINNVNFYSPVKNTN